MAKLLINKVTAAQRQIDAAIRILFAAEDPLAVRTVAAAAHGVLLDLAERRGFTSLNWEKVIRDTYDQLVGRVPPDTKIKSQVPEWKSWFRKMERKPANFLKHANRDPEALLEVTQLYDATDRILLEAIATFVTLGFELTMEMSAFGRWHLSVYPSQLTDEIQTAAGLVHELTREEQLEFGEFLLSIYRDG